MMPRTRSSRCGSARRQGCIDGERRARSTARCASPFARLKPNFESFCPVEMNSWVWALHAGRDPQHDVGPVPTPEAIKASIRSIRRTSRRSRAARLPRSPGVVRRRLVVAVHGAGRCRDPSGHRDVEFATRGHVEQHPLVVRELRHRPAQERLGGIDHPVPAERRDRLAAPARRCSSS